ncbi:hypothetical protein BDQ12DRAFT_565291, partial [Crucibulum laeve]
TGEGTSNLQHSVALCLKLHGDKPVPQSTTGSSIPYSEAAHCTLLALCCAKEHRPFNSVLDEDYQAEVEMLQPGTKLPHPATINNDVKSLYNGLSRHVKSYFQV